MKKYAVILILLLPLMMQAQNVVQWRGDNRDGKYSETGLLKSWPENGPTLLWHVDDLGEGHTSACVTNNRIFISGMKDSIGYVYCFDLSGKLIWKTPYGKEFTESWPGVRTTPALRDGKLYLMSGYGNVVCMDAEKGTILWKVDLMKQYGGLNITWGFTENLLIEGNMLFCAPGGPVNNVLALDKNTGKLIWSCAGKGEKSAYGSPMIIRLPNIKILVMMMEKSILGIDISNGKLLWSHEQTNQWAVHPNVPVYDNGLLFCASGYGRGGVMLKVAPDGKTISELWRNTTMDTRLGGFIIHEGRIYGSGDKTKKFQCLDEKTGNLIYSMDELAPSNVIFDEGLLYVYAESGNVALVQPEATQFKVLGRFKVPYGTAQHWAHLVIAGKKLYLRHGNSLMVYDIAARKP